MSINEDRTAEESPSLTRPSVPELDAILGKRHDVLDHGFIRLIDYMGDDSAIVQAARVSYGRGTRQSREDEGLIRYLMRHHHTTPFEMCEIKLHVKLPIFVARQWIRHRTANVNEYSARYSVLDREFYVPAPEQMAAQSTTNRQGRGEVLESRLSEMMREAIREDSERSFEIYHWLLNSNEDGEQIDKDRPALSRELSRVGLGLNTYTQWYWKVDLHNLLHFLRLRADPHAQYEIRAYADILLDIVSRWVPATYQAFLDYQLNAFSLSGPALSVVKALLRGEPPDLAAAGLSKREWSELEAKLGVAPQSAG